MERRESCELEGGGQRAGHERKGDSNESTSNGKEERKKVKVDRTDREVEGFGRNHEWDDPDEGRTDILARMKGCERSVIRGRNQIKEE